jgi:hypothetical protein
VIDSIPKLMRDEKNIEDAQKEGNELFLDVCESFRRGERAEVPRIQFFQRTAAHGGLASERSVAGRSERGQALSRPRVFPRLMEQARGIPARRVHLSQKLGDGKLDARRKICLSRTSTTLL